MNMWNLDWDMQIRSLSTSCFQPMRTCHSVAVMPQCCQMAEISLCGIPNNSLSLKIFKYDLVGYSSCYDRFLTFSISYGTTTFEFIHLKCVIFGSILIFFIKPLCNVQCNSCIVDSLLITVRQWDLVCDTSIERPLAAFLFVD